MEAAGLDQRLYNLYHGLGLSSYLPEVPDAALSSVSGSNPVSVSFCSGWARVTSGGHGPFCTVCVLVSGVGPDRRVLLR